MPRRRTPHHLMAANALKSVTILDNLGADAEPLHPALDATKLADLEPADWPAAARDGCWLTSMKSIRAEGKVVTLAVAMYEHVFKLGNLDGFRLKRTPSCHPGCCNPLHVAQIPSVSRPRRPPKRILPPVKLEHFELLWDDGKLVTVGQIVKYLMLNDRFQWPDRCILANGSPDTTDKKSLRRGFFRITAAEPLKPGIRLLSSCGNYDCVNPRHARPVFGRRTDAKAIIQLQTPTTLTLDQLIEKAAREQGLAMPRDELEKMAEANGMPLYDFLKTQILTPQTKAPAAPSHTRTTREWYDELEDCAPSMVTPRKLVALLSLEWKDHPFADPDTLSFVDILPALADNLPNLREAIAKSPLWRSMTVNDPNSP